MSSVLVLLIGTVFLVQSRSYSRQVQRSGAHDNARSVTELVAAEVRNTMRGGVVTARADSLTIRTPMVLAAVCGVSGSFAYVQFEGGEAELDEAEVGGFGVLNSGTGAWSYYNTTWANIDGGGAPAASSCEVNGADTVGARDDFMRLARLGNYHGSVPAAGSIIMIFRQTTFKVKTSAMDPSTLALYRGSYGKTPVEYATGINSASMFSYRRTGTSSYSAPVSGLQLSSIDAIRIGATAKKRATTGSLGDVTYGWSINVPLRNAR